MLFWAEAAASHQGTCKQNPRVFRIQNHDTWTARVMRIIHAAATPQVPWPQQWTSAKRGCQGALDLLRARMERVLVLMVPSPIE